MALSLLFALLRAGPLNGTVAALVLVALLQVLLPGALLARALGRLAEPQPVARLMWALAAGLGLTVCLGTAARLLHLPVEAYLALLHAVMLALALLRPLPPAAPLALDAGRLAPGARLPLYALLALSCLLVTGVSAERSRFRFSGYEDQTVFVAQAEWLAHDPDDPAVLDRRIGTPGDPRNAVDGWTYNHAAWVWQTGVPAANLIWYHLSPLLAWAAPLAVFALAWAATGSERTAALSAAAYTLAGLLTLDTLVYVPNVLAIGQYALVQLNTLRTFSTALLLPLGIFVGLALLRAPRRADLGLLLLVGLATASAHPRQAMLLAISLGATVTLWLLARPGRARLRWAGALALALALTVALPFAQRQARTPTLALTERVLGAAAADAAPLTFRGFRLVEVTLPLLGATTVVHPQSVFYHPAVWLAALLALAAAPAWRRSLAAQHLVGATGAALLLLFLPGLSQLYTRLVTVEALWGTVYVVPVGLAWGCAFDFALRWLERRRVPPALVAWGAPAALAAVMLALLFEPFPISASSRDQIAASNTMQQGRDITAADRLLLDMLARSLPADGRSVILSPSASANFIIESVPRTFITGGRPTVATPGTQRFFNEAAPYAPWLDADDLAYLAEWGVTHIVAGADDTRLPQLLAQPQRFRLLDRAGGYLLFEVAPGVKADAADALYGEMNALYADAPRPRWGRDGFELAHEGDRARWAPLARGWARRLAADPADARARAGLAFTYTLMGADQQALPLWEALHAQQPDAYLYASALAHTRQRLGAADAAAPLLAALASADPALRALAARDLLTPPFFAALAAQPGARQSALDVIASGDPAWAQLADDGQPDAQRRRAALLAYAGEWRAALALLDALPPASVSPRDLTAAAALALALGDLDGALARLRPAADPDWRAPRAAVHPDRWAHNSAAGAYELLLGELAARAGRADDARDHFRRAADGGAPLAGRWFLAAALDDAGRADEAAPVRAELAALWAAEHDAPFPALEPLLALYDAGALFAVGPQVERGGDESALTLWAAYADPTPHGAYPVQTWRAAVLDAAAGTVYGLTDAGALAVDGALVRASVAVTLRADTPALTPALAFVEPRHSPLLTAPPLTAPLTLNRPESAAIPPGAETLGYRFGDSIVLEAYTAEARTDGVDVTLYWRADTPPAASYQVFVHAVCGGAPAAQSDSAPAGGRYPTDQWRPGAVVADAHALAWDTPPAGPCELVAGLYRLGDLARLPVSPAGARVRGDSLLLETFTLPAAGSP